MPTLTLTSKGFTLLGVTEVPRGFSRRNGSVVTLSPSAAYPFITWADTGTKTALERAEATKLASRSTSPTKPLKLAPRGFSFFPYQEAGIEFMVAHKKCLLADEPGTGKTPMSAGLINAVKPFAVLVLCPSSLQLNWKYELDRWLTHTPEILDIVSYDSAWRKGQAQALLATKYDVVIMDEAHYCKNGESKRSKTAHYCKNGGSKRSKTAQVLASRAERVVLLTGTPMDNRPRDLFVLLKMIAPRMFPDFNEFAIRYCRAFVQEIRTRQGVKRIWNTEGSSNEEELQDILRSFLMIRRLKQDVLPQLPKKIRQLIIVPPEKTAAVKAEKKLWESVCQEVGYEEALKHMEAGAGVAFDKMAKARQEVAVSKVPFVVKHISNIASAQKVIVFAHHKAVVEALMQGLSEFNPVKVVGGMSAKEKDASVVTFQNDDKCRVFVGNITAAGVGLTLTASSTVVFAELPFRPSDAIQGEDRACRIGASSDKVLVQHIILDGSLDVKLARMLIHKQNVCDKVLDK